MPGSCGNGNTDFGGAVQFDNAGALVKRGASGHYVVDQEHVFPTHVVSAFESATHVFLAFLQRETGLWQCRPDSLQAAAVNPNFAAFSDNGSDFHRLVEAAFAQTFCMQWHGNDQIDGGVDMFGKAVPQPMANGQLMAVLEGLNDAVNRKFVAK